MPVRERALTVKKCWEKQCGRKNTDSCGQFAADPFFCLSKALFVLVILFRMEYNKKTKLKKYTERRMIWNATDLYMTCWMSRC